MTEGRDGKRKIKKDGNGRYTAVIFGGTVEGRLLAERFAGSRICIHVSVATKYGASLLPKADNLSVHQGRMDEREMEEFLEETGCNVCVDATHPYAVEVTKNIRAACEQIGVEYIRVLRKTDCFAGGSEQNGGLCGEILFVDSVQAAAEYLAGTEGNILITTGSKELSQYTVIPGYRDRCFARVLPTLPVMESCRALGFEGRNLIGMQGPFSEEMNLATIRQCDARYMVTKQSGANGGYGEKCEAALRAGIRLVVVGAPGEECADGVSLEEAVSKLYRFGGLDNERLERNDSAPGIPEGERLVSLVGMGPGNPELCTGEAVERLKQAEVLIGAGRVLEICDRISGELASKPHFVGYRAEEISLYLKEHPEYKRIALAFSGDIGFYSGARRAAACLGTEYRIERIPGLSSPIYFLDRLGVSWSEVCLASCHGQDCDVAEILKEKKRVCLLLGREGDVPRICEELILAGLGDASLTVGERLSYEDERIVGGTAESLAGQVFDPLSVVYIEWENML